MNRKLLIGALIVGTVGCVHRNQDSPAPAPAAAPAAAPAPAPASGKFPGMNEKGEVISAKDVEQGHGRVVKVGDLEGEITGIPAPGTKFTRLQIGMGMKEVVDLIGPPTDQGAYITGKAFIPFYFGGDRHRVEFVYKAQGRLVFAGGGGYGDYSGGRLIWIIHSAREVGYR